MYTLEGKKKDYQKRKRDYKCRDSGNNIELTKAFEQNT